MAVFEIPDRGQIFSGSDRVSYHALVDDAGLAVAAEDAE